jgi:uncharacterized UPF0160 family protein
MNGTPPILATHSGKFHCDEVFAYAVLRLALGLRQPGTDHILRRTRQAELIESADIVWDVGAVFDAPANRFDHHQRGAPLREDGTPFSAAGLVWQVYGERAVAALLQAKNATAFAPLIAADIENSLVKRIDELDNGVAADGPVKSDALGLGSLIEDCNPTWDDPDSTGPQAGDTAFLVATEIAAGTLRRRVEVLRARYAATQDVLAAYEAAEDKRILVLSRGMPWKNVVFSHDLPVLYAASPASNGNWMVDAVPPEPGSFAQRLPLPEAWAGLQNEELAAVSGVPDAVFTHLRRFVAAAKTQEGALALARIAVAAG